MTLPLEMTLLIAAIERNLARVRWRLEDGIPKEHDALAYVGDTDDGWRYTVVSFDIVEQGFPPGSRGYDGAVAANGMIVRMTREFAQLAFQSAELQTRDTS